MAAYKFYLASLLLTFLLVTLNVAEVVQFHQCDDNPGNLLLHHIDIIGFKFQYEMIFRSDC